MKIVSSLLDIKNENDEFPTIGLTIGNFDGVHLGHRELLTKIRSDCKSKKNTFVVLTFIPHPQKIIQPDKERFLITSYEHRRRLLLSAGVDYLVEINFTRDFSTLSAEDFLKSHLLTYPQLNNFYLGYDFAFGANKKGGFDLVQSLCLPRNVQVEIQPKFEQGGNIISSTSIRNLLKKGLVEDVSQLLTRSFQLEGVVVKGEGRGKKIGFPTANIQCSQDLIVPQNGVYVTKTHYNGMIYNSVTNIGHNPTFKDTKMVHIETNIFDFNLDIYGENIEIEFLSKIRDEKKFQTVNELIEQIRNDVDLAKKRLGSR
jgi:riboflavin kinase/FMN adenylyltransferase